MAALQQISGECHYGSLTAELCGAVTMVVLQHNSVDCHHGSLTAELWRLSPWQPYDRTFGSVIMAALPNSVEVSSWQPYSSTMWRYHHGHLTDKLWGVSPCEP